MKTESDSSKFRNALRSSFKIPVILKGASCTGRIRGVKLPNGNVRLRYYAKEFSPSWDVTPELLYALQDQFEDRFLGVEKIDGDHSDGMIVQIFLAQPSPLSSIVERVNKLALQGKITSQGLTPGAVLELKAALHDLIKIDYEKLVTDAGKDYKYARGTYQCIAFKHGAEWLEQRIATKL